MRSVTSLMMATESITLSMMMIRAADRAATQQQQEVAELTDKENLDSVWFKTISSHHISIDSYLQKLHWIFCTLQWQFIHKLQRR